MNELIILGVLLLLSGFFSGAETAMVSLSMARAESLYRQKRTGAHALFMLKQDPSRMLITILIGNNVVNIAASAIATVIATEHFGHLGPGIAVGTLTIFILVFGEITPKSLATRFAERISLFVAPIIYVLMRLIYPLVWLFLQFTDWVSTLTSAHRDPIVTESEVITLVEHGEEEGVIETDERDMIERIFIFNDLTAEDVMTPRRQVFRLDGHRKVDDVYAEVLDQSYSRIPLYEGNPDEIVSQVNLRDLMKAVADGKRDIPISQIAVEPLFTPANTPADDLFHKLRRSRKALAIVVDEHGVMIGVVTLEDLLEEIVGEIYDETDEKTDLLTPLGESKALVNGTAELRVVEEYFGMDIPGKPTDTISRWVLNHTERIPEIDEKFEIDGLLIQVQDASLRRIHRVILEKIPIDDQSAGSNT